MSAAHESLDHSEFLRWLDGWSQSLPVVPVPGLPTAPEDVAVLVVDLLVGFCSEGALASPRVRKLAAPCAEFLRRARAAGVRQLLLCADSHPPDSPEFAAFPPHCIAGTAEAAAVQELQELPFFEDMIRFPKRSLNVGLEPEFQEWVDLHRDIRDWVVLGDCTDLCVYQAAMHLRLHANARGLKTDVWVPAALVDTYDLGVKSAQSLGALPHDADLLHRLFLYHLALNGIRVVRSFQWPA